MLKTVSILFGLLLAVVWVAAQEAPKPAETTTSISTTRVDAAQKTSPVKPTAESLARGKRQFGYDCAMCHGKAGDSTGEVAADLKLKMKDHTNPATLKGLSDGDLFFIIKKGKDQMPPEGDRVKNEEIWDMVNYVRSFAQKDHPTGEKAPK